MSVTLPMPWVTLLRWPAHTAAGCRAWQLRISCDRYISLQQQHIHYNGRALGGPAVRHRHAGDGEAASSSTTIVPSNALSVCFSEVHCQMLIVYQIQTRSLALLLCAAIHMRIIDIYDLQSTTCPQNHQVTSVCCWSVRWVTWEQANVR